MIQANPQKSTQIAQPMLVAHTDQFDETAQAVLPVRPQLFDRMAWRDAAVVWLAQRIVFVALTYLVRWRVVARPANTPYPSWSEMLQVWTNWDSAIYASIARNGYTQLTDAAFFPLFPFLERLLTPFTAGSPAIAGLVIANACALVAFALLRVLVERDYGRDVAQRTLLYLAIFPFSLFLAAAYTEPLFLLLSVAVFLALREQRWWLAGLFAALATLTRPVGILLLLPLVVAYWVSLHPGNLRLLPFPIKGASLALLLPIVVLVGFNLALAPHYGTLTAPTLAQVQIWGRHLSWPWDGLIQAGTAALHTTSIFYQWHAILDICWTLLFVALALATVRRLPLPYSLYACATAVVVLLTPMHIPHFEWATLASNGRFLLVVFPIFLLLALWSDQRRWLHRLIVTVSLTLSLLLALVFIMGAFVA